MYNTLIQQTNVAIKIRFKVINLHHKKKVIKFRIKQQKNRISKDPEILKSTIQNCSSYELTTEGMNALAYGLDHHVPTKADRNTITTEFEQFFQNLLKDITHIPENKVGQIKTKLCNTCEKYCHVKVSNYQNKVINNLSEREDIIIMKQHKGRGVVIMDKTKYTDKCLPLSSLN